MQHKGTIVFETARLLLRPFTLEDAQELFTNCFDSQKMRTFLPAIKPQDSAEDSRVMLESIVSGYVNPNYYYWAIVPKALGQVIGSLMLHLTPRDELHGRVEVGYYLGEPFWGQGYASEALAAALDFCFDQVGFTRVFAIYDVVNGASGRVLEKCGMKYEGRLRGAISNKDGTFADVYIYGIIAADRK